jgi:DNA repair exonuclease SbcCD ATPase subunit
LQNGTIEEYKNLEINAISNIGVGAYIPFAPAPLKFRKEPMMEKQLGELENSLAQMEARMNSEIQELQTSLARANHENFTKQAELEIIREMLARPQAPDPETSRLVGEINRLSELIRNPPVQKPPAMTVSAEAQEAALFMQKQIADLQKNLQWYKDTYEDRSFLGVVKQKIALKFAK